MGTREPKSYPKGEPITAVGIIVPVEWDIDGNPVRVALSTNDESEYIIDRTSGKGREIAKRLQKQVKVDGIPSGNGSIIVQHYECIDYGGSENRDHYSENMIKYSLKSREE